MRKEIKAKLVKKQLEFCKELMNRLVADVNETFDGDLESSWWGLKNHTVFENDIVRLRRELMKAAELLKGDIYD